MHEEVGDGGHRAPHTQPHALGDLVRGRHGEHGIDHNVNVGNNAERREKAEEAGESGFGVSIFNAIVEQYIE